MTKKLAPLICLIVASLLLFTGAKKSERNEDLLIELDSVNKTALMIGDSVRGKLEDMQLEAYNDRMISDHRVIANSLNDISRKLDLELKGKTDKYSLDGKKGQALANEYLEEVIEIHQKTLKKLKREISALEQEDRMKEFTKNIRDRINTLLENAYALQSETK